MANISNDTNSQIFYGAMEWFEPLDQPSDFDCLPAAFKEANELWEDDKEKNIDEIIK